MPECSEDRITVPCMVKTESELCVCTQRVSTAHTHTFERLLDRTVGKIRGLGRHALVPGTPADAREGVFRKPLEPYAELFETVSYLGEGGDVEILRDHDSSHVPGRRAQEFEDGVSSVDYQGEVSGESKFLFT